MIGKKFQIYDVHIARKYIELRHFYSYRPDSKFAPKFLSSHPRQKETTHSLRQHFFENLFSEQWKEVEETMTCFIKIQAENMKMTWDIRLFVFCMIYNFFKCDGVTVLQIIYIM